MPIFDISRFNAETIILSKEELNLTMMLEQIVDDSQERFVLHFSHKKTVQEE